MATTMTDLFRTPMIIMKVLSYLDNRENAALTCKDFYKHICHLERSYYRLSLNEQRVMNKDFVAQLLMSQREISEVHLGFTPKLSLERLQPILAKFKLHVRKLTIRGNHPKPEISTQVISNILQNAPKLEKVFFENLKIIDSGVKLELNLCNLKKVSFEICEVRTIEVMNIFPSGMIQEIDIKATSFPVGLLTTQPNIKVLTIEENMFAFNSGLNEGNFELLSSELGQLKLSRLSLSGFEESCRNFLINRSHLTSLKLPFVRVDDDDFDLICEMKKLIELELNVSELNASALHNLDRLQSLTSLNLCGGTESHLIALEILEMPNLERLALKNFPKIDQLWARVGGRFRNLQRICYHDCHDLSTMRTLVRQFTKLQLISVKMENVISCGQQEILDPNDFEALKEFKITANEVTQSAFIPFINSCENLKKIYFHAPQSIDMLKHLVLTKKKLRELSMLIEKDSWTCPDITNKIIEAIVDNGACLFGLRLCFHEILETATHKQINPPFDLKIISDKMKDRFPIIIWQGVEGGNLIIRKRGVNVLKEDF